MNPDLEMVRPADLPVVALATSSTAPSVTALAVTVQELEDEVVTAGIEDPAVATFVRHAEGLDRDQIFTAFRFLRQRMMGGAARTEGVAYCPSRGGNLVVDTWVILPNEDRVCSCCGSISPLGFLKICLEACEPNSRVWLDPAANDAGRVYIRRLDVEHIDEGATRFLSWHLSWLDSGLAQEIRRTWLDALRASAEKRERWRRRACAASSNTAAGHSA